MTTLKQDLEHAMDDNLIFSCNQSPTLSGKIKHVAGDHAVVEVVANPSDYMASYNKKHAHQVGTLFMMPLAHAHNAIYF